MELDFNAGSLVGSCGRGVMLTIQMSGLVCCSYALYYEQVGKYLRRQIEATPVARIQDWS